MTTTCAPYVTCSPVAGGTSTLSKSPQLFPENAPTHLWQALGSQVWGTDSRQYTDWISGLMAITLGHNHPEVTAAVVTHLGYGGPTWSLPHRLEEEVAATLCRLIGHPDWQVRWFKTGSEANTAALRIARALTGRAHYATNGYHGWHDPLLVTPPAWGRAPNTMAYVSALPFNDLDTWRVAGDVHAAAIIEPETTVAPDPAFLAGLRMLCTRRGALLIADECITGGRYPEWSAMRHYGVEPDLYIFSKGLANGWPLACVVGAPEHMRCFDVDWAPAWLNGAASPTGPVYASGTWATETSGLAAAAATLAVWEREKVAERIGNTGRLLGYSLMGARNDAGISPERVGIKGPNYRLLLDCPSLEDKTRIMARMIEKGHLIGTGWNITAAHTEEDIESVVGAFRYALERLDEPAGRCVVAPYRQA